MKRSITWGAIAGVVLGATVTFALSRGWLTAPWTNAPDRAPVSTRVDDVAPGALAAPRPFARPLRPGSFCAGDVAAVSRS